MKSIMTKKINIDITILEELNRFIQQAKSVLVVAHIDPDGDSLGSLLAMTSFLKELGKDVYPVITDEIPQKYGFLKGIHEIPAKYNEDELKIDTAILLECPNQNRINGPAKYILDICKIINIDHHRDNKIKGDFNWVDSSCSSVGEMLYEYFEYINFKLSKEIAEYLYVAILTDTGRFRFASTSSRTLQVASRLIDFGADPRKITDMIYYEMEPTAIVLTGKVLNSVEYMYENKLCIMTLNRKMVADSDSKKSDAEGLVDFTMFGKGVKIGVFLKEVNDRQTKVSLRSKNDIDVAEIASLFGGGGHKNAAGCSIDLSLSETKKKLIKTFEEILG